MAADRIGPQAEDEALTGGQEMKDGRHLTVGLNVAALLCFFLTFFTVSCQEERVVSLTGVDLVVGKTLESNASFAPSQKTRIEPTPLAAIAALLAAVAAAAGAGAGAFRAWVAAATGGASTFTLLLLKDRIVGDVARQEMGEMLTVRAESGFWIALLALLGASLLAIRTALTGVRAAETPSSAAHHSPDPG